MLILLFALVTGLLISASLVAEARDLPAAPSNLRCEFQQNPLGLDTSAPRLSWQVEDSRRGARQTAYQILVATRPELLAEGQADVWDSGKVESSESVQVPYAGPELQSRQGYYWCVRTWDQAGASSPWSAPAYWEMGLLEAEDWQAEWIAAPDDRTEATPGEWIWHPTEVRPHVEIELRKHFELPEDFEVQQVRLSATCDDYFTLYLNGEEVGSGSDWHTLWNFEAKELLRPGDNVLAVKAGNEESACGFTLGLELEDASGRVISVKTDGTWKAASGSKGEWFAREYDDSQWVSARSFGPFGVEPWGGKRSKGLRSVYMRKEFDAKGAIKRARLYSTGLGLYELYLNGKRVGEDLFTPGWTNYAKRLQYQTYDVTDLVQAGANALGALLGNGWYSGGMGWGDPFVYAKASLKLLAQLEIEYEDGSREVVATGPDWKFAPSPILENTFYHGETWDARLEQPGWAEPGFAAADWQAVEIIKPLPIKLCAQQAPTIRCTAELAPAEIKEVAPGTWVVDFGQNAAGRCRLQVKAPEGTRVQLRFAELLNPDGTLYTANYRSARATDVYICKGEGEEVWEPHFTYRGFRYVEVTGLPSAPGPETLTMRVIHSAAPEIGDFECSNELINQIWRNAFWGLRSNLHSVPTDCPQRDERLGWTGDAQLFAPTACWDMQLARFFEKWINDLFDSQAPEGYVTDVAPVAVLTGPAAPAWGDACIIVPWTVYLQYGDERILADHYEQMKAWVEYMRSQSKGYLYEVAKYGDWVPVEPSPSAPIGSEYFFYSTKLLSKIAKVLHKEEDAAEYAELAERIRAAFNAKHFDYARNSYTGDTQTANLLPLAFGIAPDDRREAILANLLRDIREHDYHLTTGFIGTAYLLPVLSEFGQAEIAWKIAVQRTYPSWGYMVEKGATTIWERWNSDIMGPEMNSRNHFALGAVVRWYYENLGGLRLDEAAPGLKHFVVKPEPVGDLQRVKVSYASEYGPVESAWERTDEAFTLHVVIPANTTCTVYVPLLGRDAPTLYEGEIEVLAEGKESSEVEGLEFKGISDGYACFEAGAGRYEFKLALR